MPADSNIFQAYLNAPKSVLDYQTQYNQADAAKIALQKGQMDLSNAADVNRQRNALRDAVTSGQVDLSNPDHVSRILSLAPDVAPAMLKTVQEGATSRALAAKDTSIAGKNNQETQLANHAQHLQALSTVNTPEDAVQWMVNGVKSGALPADGLPQALQALQASAANPADFAKWKAGVQQTGVTVQKQIEMATPKPTEVRLGNVVKTIDMNPQSPSFGKEVVSPQAIGVSPDTVATNATHITTTGMTQAGEDRRANQTDKRVRELNAVGDSSPDTEQQLNYWADVIRKGGTLPPGLARGPGGSAFVREATKRAAMGDTTPADMMANQAEFAGQKAGQRTLGTKQANIEMAATEAYNMMPIAVAASEKVDRTQYPLLNKVLLAAEKGTGDTSVVQLAVATNSLVNSYSRAISPSGTPTVSDKDHAREILETAYAKGQYSAAVNMMKQEIEQARKSPGQVRANMRPGAKPEEAAPAAAPAGLPSGWSVKVN